MCHNTACRTNPVLREQNPHLVCIMRFIARSSPSDEINIFAPRTKNSPIKTKSPNEVCKNMQTYMYIINLHEYRVCTNSKFEKIRQKACTIYRTWTVFRRHYDTSLFGSYRIFKCILFDHYGRNCREKNAHLFARARKFDDYFAREIQFLTVANILNSIQSDSQFTIHGDEREKRIDTSIYAVCSSFEI